MNIKSLKDKILQLAIQGKLVPQNENDEPASVLLEKIKAEKEQLIKDKIIKKEKPLPEISEDEKSFDLPKGWEWCRLGDIITLISGRDLNNSICNNEGIGIPYIMGASNMSKDGLVIERWTESPTVIGLKNDIIISVKGTVGKLDIIDLEKVHLSRQVMSMRCYSGLIFNKYILLYLQSYIERIKEKSSGVIPGISRDNLLQILVAVPPLEEQKRIVAKVDELFELIDELDKNKQELLENISNTRNKVLQLAIQGKLVDQCKDDEPASVLLERIKAEKEQLIKDKIIKKEKALAEIGDEEKSFDLPKGWEWSYMEDSIILATDYVANGSFKSLRENVNTFKEENYALLIKTQDFSNNFTQNLTYIDKESYEFLSKSKLFGGELMLSNIGASIGKAFIIPNFNMPMSLAPNSIMIKCNSEITTLYIKNLILSYYGQNYLKELTSGTAMPKFNKTQLRKMVIPLPPLEEQKRIIEKIDIIMNYLDKLQQEIESQEIILEDILK